MSKMVVSEVQALSRFFGKNGKTLAEFNAEIKALSPTEKRELATLAAEALGCELAPPKEA